MGAIMRELMPAVFLVAFGVVVLLLVLLMIFRRLRRLRTARAMLGSEWAERTGTLNALVNARGQRRDEREAGSGLPARPQDAVAGAA
jgi:uncharacterized membrane protein